MVTVVERPVGLDDEPVSQAEEVDNVRPYWDLPAELEAVDPAAPQQPPELSFAIDRRVPHTFGEGEAGFAAPGQGEH
jgi:hypothetical protein